MTEHVPANLNSHLSAANPLPADLKELADLIEQAAIARQGDSTALLALLRLLEDRHRNICDSLFRDALPNNRHNLYSLLKDIELNGGWPYIQRMKLQALFANLPTPEIEPPPQALD